MPEQSLVRRAALALALGLLMIAGPAAAQRGSNVDLELVLAVDVSGSMDAEEQRVQREGYIQAFRHGAVLSAIRSGIYRQIAVTYVQWAAEPEQTIPWTIISNAQDIENFAKALEAAPIYSYRGTSISSALTLSASLFDNNTMFRGTRRVIDISGDGPNNSGGPVLAARDAVLEKGIVINGLPVLMNTQYSATPLDQYYRDCVIGGKGAFMIPVTTVDRFIGTIRAKLVTEIANLAKPPETPGEAKYQLAQAIQRPQTDCRTQGGGFQP